MLDKKFRGLLIVQAVLALGLLLTCFQREEPVYAIRGEEMAGRTVETEGGREFSGEEIALFPGVYQVRMETSIQGKEAVFAEMRQNGAAFSALRNNGATSFAGCSEIRFLVYVSGKIPEAYVFCRFSDAGADALRSLTVYRTGIGNRVLLCILLSFFVLLDFFLLFRRRILSGEVTGKQQLVFWSLTAGVLIAYFPFLTDYIIPGDDLFYHLQRIAFLKDTWQQGPFFPVRVQSTWLYGHGYATSLFYGDFFLYFPAFLMAVGFPLMSAYKIFVFAVLLAGAWIGYHCLYKCLKEEYAALLGSAMYLLAPYRLYNLYNRAALGEFLAMTFLPLVCCGMYLLYTENEASADYGKHKWYLILGMSALLQSHLITAQMTAVLLAAACALLWKKTFRKRTFCQLLEAVGMVLLINMWFWLPLLYMIRADRYQFQSVIQQEMIYGTELAGLLQLLPNKGMAHPQMRHWEPIQIGVGALLLLMAYLLWRLSGHKTRKVCGFFAVLTVLSVILSTRYIPWNFIRNVPVIGYFVGSWQFPFRWMAPACALAAFFSAFLLSEVRQEAGMRLKALTGLAVFLVPLSAVYHVNNISLEGTAYFLYNQEYVGTTGILNGEWLLAGSDPNEIRYHGPVAEDGLTWRDYEKNGTSVDIFLENDSAETRCLELPLMGYKGYTVEETDGEGTAAPTVMQKRGAHNDLRIEVPGGYQGRIHVAYEGSLLMRMAEIVSLMSILAVLGGRVLQRKGTRNVHEKT